MFNVDPGIEYAQNALWGNVWLQAIALAWSNEALRDALLRNPGEFVFNQFGYTLPRGMTLRVVTCATLSTLCANKTDASFQLDDFKHLLPFDLSIFEKGGKVGWDAYTMTWTLPNNVVVMFLPPSPEVKDQAVALAAYVGTGRSYPFTTC